MEKKNKDKNKSNRSVYVTAFAMIISAVIGAIAVIYTGVGHRIIKQNSESPKVKIIHDSLSSFTISRKLQLQNGSFVKLKDNFERPIKITLKSIRKLQTKSIIGKDSTLYAKISIDAGGRIVYGGNLTIQESVNTYFMPVIKYDKEDLYSIYFFYTNNKDITFFRLFIENINPYQNELTMKVFFLNRVIYSQ
jgi:hypothetical protein